MSARPAAREVVEWIAILVCLVTVGVLVGSVVGHAADAVIR